MESKKVNLKNKDVIEINESLFYLSEKQTGAWYGVSKNIRSIKNIMEEINASRNEIVKKMAKLDKDGNPVKGDNNGIVWKDEKKANIQFEELLNEQISVSVFEIPMSKFDESDKLDSFAIAPLIDIIITD